MSAGFDGEDVAGAREGASFGDALSGPDGTREPAPTATRVDRFDDALALALPDTRVLTMPPASGPWPSVPPADPRTDARPPPAAQTPAAQRQRAQPAATQRQATAQRPLTAQGAAAVLRPATAQRPGTAQPPATAQRPGTIQRPGTAQRPAPGTAGAATQAPRNPYGQPQRAAGPIAAPVRPQSQGGQWFAGATNAHRSPPASSSVSTTATAPASAPRGTAPGSTVRLGPGGQPPPPGGPRRPPTPARTAERWGGALFVFVIVLLFATGLGQRLLDALTDFLGR